jgi:trk system potassium uptake protein TrkH
LPRGRRSTHRRRRFVAAAHARPDSAAVNVGAISRVLAGFVGFFTVAELFPWALSLTEDGAGGVRATAGFSAGIVLGVVAAVLLWSAGRRAPAGFYRRETLCVAVVAWVLASVLGAVPFQWSGLLPDGTDALFESVSGLTTCGGTVLGTNGNPTPENTPASLLLWRALLQWLGGIGIVLVFVSLLPAGTASKHLLMAESVGVGTEGYQPRMLHQTRWVVGIYVLLTVACAGGLQLVGMDLFDAVCHAFTCLSTGGYSTRTSIASFDSLWVEVVLTVFMYLGGCSFTVMAGVLRDGTSGLRAMVRTGEFRIYTLVTVAMVTATTVDLTIGGLSPEMALRQASFNVVSMLSCCGYATADFQAWPPLSLLVIFACTVFGGCSGSAAGGMKQVRLLVCLRLFVFTVRRFVQPNRVDRLRLDDEVLQASTVSSVLAVVLLWLLTVLVGAAVIALDQRLGFVGALTTSASMLGNCGPAMTAVDPASLAAGLPEIGQAVKTLGPNVGPFGGFGDLSGWTKLVLAFQMILGRLELLPVLALLTPAFWRR